MIDIVNVYECQICKNFFEKYQMIEDNCEVCYLYKEMGALRSELRKVKKTKNAKIRELKSKIAELSRIVDAIP